ncbi:hypothetical protein FDG2_3288 [Candidatus Protofrankia californiensis]|uniref:Uncharacterized protein n=1 Tax=Candidatus Protofrankia californiensis TaxID=1839754 RepID=A0A1C3NZD2_9ACTN|nr:hypothetical protein FDG2_3288 [Candidatus Protofrankia californiensis]
MRRDSRRFVRDLGLPPASSIRELLPAVEERSGYSIRLVPAPGDSEQGVCGMWMRSVEGVDYIFVHENTSRVHQDHIIAHEIAHILRDHRGSLAFLRANPMTDRLVPTLDPAVVKMMLGRSNYEYEDEREAELIGSYIQRLIHRTGRLAGNHDRMAATLLRRR